MAAEQRDKTLVKTRLLQQQISSLQQSLSSSQRLQLAAKTQSLNVGQSIIAHAQTPVNVTQRLDGVSQSVEVGKRTTTRVQDTPQNSIDLNQSVMVNQTNEVLPEHQFVQVSRSLPKPPTIVPTYNYKVRIINPNKKSDVKVRLLHNFTSKFKSIKAIKEVLLDQLEDLVNSSGVFDVGYTEGSQQKIWLANKEDLLSMYKVYPNGGNVTLWCDGKSSKKREAETGTGTRRQDKEEELDSVFKELRKKHSDMEYPKLRVWARLINAGQYDSYDEPPDDLPYFGCERKKPKRGSLEDALTGAANVVCKMFSPPENSSDSTFSPTKQVNLRMKNYEQLRSLKSLFEDGILERSEYNEQKENIMDTLRKLKD